MGICIDLKGKEHGLCFFRNCIDGDEGLPIICQRFRSYDCHGTKLMEGAQAHDVSPPRFRFGGPLNLDLSDLAGKKCVRIVGTIETHKGRPAIIIKSRDQILPCLGKE